MDITNLALEKNMLITKASFLQVDDFPGYHEVPTYFMPVVWDMSVARQEESSFLGHVSLCNKRWTGRVAIVVVHTCTGMINRALWWQIGDVHISGGAPWWQNIAQYSLLGQNVIACQEIFILF